MNKKNPKIVAIGGGTGLPVVLSGLKKYTDNITAIVTVTDSGGSSGKLRDAFNILPPGDIRRCMLALSDSTNLMKEIFEYRFKDLEDHSLGNLIMAALTDTTKSDELAIKKTADILNIRGKVLPVTLDKRHLCAELENGEIIKRENNIDIPKHNPELKIKRVFLDKEAGLFKECREAIREADLIILGPGDLFTSIIPNLLVSDIGKEINKSRAKKVYICNLMTKYGETNKFLASDFIKEIISYLGTNLNFIILNNRRPSEKALDNYKKENSDLVENDLEQIKKFNIKIIIRDLIGELDNNALKKSKLRHDPEKLGAILINLI